MARLCSNKACRAELPEGRKTHRCATCSRVEGQKERELQPERTRERGRRCYAKNREKRQASRKENAAAIRAYQRRWEAENRERRREADCRWRLENLERAREGERRSRAAHPEKQREKRQRRRALKKGATVGKVDIKALWDAAGGKCFYCNALIPDFPGWRQTDHYWPLSDRITGKKGTHGQDNLVAACYLCNASKGDRPPTEWKADPVLPKTGRPDQPHLFNPNWNL
jgi:5-methylcytosine-specific restriction endonuclease McrA